MLARASGALTLPENLSDDLSGYLRNPTQFVEHFWPSTGAKFRPFFPMAFPIRLTPFCVILTMPALRVLSSPYGLLSRDRLRLSGRPGGAYQHPPPAAPACR